MGRRSLEGHPTYAPRSTGAGSGGGGTISEITSSDGSIVVTNPNGPITDLVVAPSSLPKFQLALSYGQGSSGNDDLEVGESFWFQPQSVNLSPLADQIHEWPSRRALAFIGLTVYVDDAQINVDESGEDPAFIITIDGIDTIFQIALPAGSHSDETLETGGIVAIPAGSRVGVRWNGPGIDTGSTLRCEMVLDGAEVGTPIPPPPIPTTQLIADWASENYSIQDLGGGSFAGQWLDDTANNNDLTSGGSALANIAAIVPNAFNADAGVQFTRSTQTAGTEVLKKNAPTWLAANGPRTFAWVLEGGAIELGCLLHVRGATVASYNIQINGVTTPQLIWKANGGDISNIDTFIDLSGNKAVIVLWTTGGIGDPLFLSVNGVQYELDVGMFAEGLTSFIQIGYDDGVYFPDSWRLSATIARGLTWSRVLSTSERIGVIANLSARYL